MPPKINKKKAAPKAKPKAPIRPATPFVATLEVPPSSSVEENAVRNPKGLTLQPMKSPKQHYTCARGTPRKPRTDVPFLPPNSTGPRSPPRRRRAPDGMHDFRNYYALLRVDRDASHMRVSRAWERYATKAFDPLIKHKDANEELNDFILWHDVHEWLLVDEYTRAFYNSRLERFERLSAADVVGRGAYHEAFFPYDSEGEGEYDSEQDESGGLGSDF